MTVPYMEKVYPVQEHKRGQIPAVVHVDGTGRLQTVSRLTNPRFYELIQRFYEATGVPVVLNTSFKPEWGADSGEPYRRDPDILFMRSRRADLGHIPCEEIAGYETPTLLT